MIPRSLLYKEWKKNQVLLLWTGIFLIAANPFLIYLKYLSYQGCLSHQDPQYCQFIVDYSNGSLLSFSWVFGIVIAVCLLGMERTKGTMDILLSLPYSRSQIYHTKFWLGGAVIIVSQAIGYGAASILITLLKPLHVYYFHHFSVGVIVISFTAYALLMASGTITGNIFAQLLTAFSVTILPFLLIGLPGATLDIICHVSVGELFSFGNAYVNSRLFIYLTPIGYVFNDWIRERHLLMLLPAVMSMAFYLIGYFSFLKQPNERNGHFFLWRKLDRPIQVLVMIIAALGIGIFGYTVTNSMFGYAAGFIIGAAIGYLIAFFTVYRKTKRL